MDSGARPLADQLHEVADEVTCDESPAWPGVTQVLESIEDFAADGQTAQPLPPDGHFACRLSPAPSR